MTERKSSLLTNHQREYIQGRRQIENTTNERKMKSRIRERVYTGLELDGKILHELEPEERRKIFQRWEDKHYESQYKYDFLKEGTGEHTTDIERGQLNIGLGFLLGFIFLGTEETEVDSFETLLKEGIDLALRDYGRYVKNLNLEVETGELATLGDIHESLEEGDMKFEELTPEEAARLVRSGKMSVNDFPEGFWDELIKQVELFDYNSIH